VLCPTVSASTNELGSLAYSLFVVVALIYGAFLIATSFFHQVDIIVRAAEEEDDPDMTMGTLLLIGGLVIAIALILASILSAKGKTTCIQHSVLEIIYFEMALV
jgi:O-antigen/teichoic acid export membrane protein